MAGIHWLGIDYGSAHASLKMRGIRGKAIRRVFDDLQILERAALDAFHALRADAS